MIEHYIQTSQEQFSLKSKKQVIKTLKSRRLKRKRENLFHIILIQSPRIGNVDIIHQFQEMNSIRGNQYKSLSSNNSHFGTLSMENEVIIYKWDDQTLQQIGSSVYIDSSYNCFNIHLSAFLIFWLIAIKMSNLIYLLCKINNIIVNIHGNHLCLLKLNSYLQQVIIILILFMLSIITITLCSHYFHISMQIQLNGIITLQILIYLLEQILTFTYSLNNRSYNVLFLQITLFNSNIISHHLISLILFPSIFITTFRLILNIHSIQYNKKHRQS
ncbi:unnamed protein product [Paramecium octaurelia]|uniref:Transmembrane protein n=1 Tax=Paramecium octaurelia TaxID=43137 RepID=A0A8S1XEC7_PAROT|nr:unnamed protein product [Paramecium octaurelia]